MTIFTKSIRLYHKLRLLVAVIVLLAVSVTAKAQLPHPALVGYFHNWQASLAPYVQLPNIDSRYNVINISFAIPKAGTSYDMVFVPEVVSQSVFISQVQALQAEGKKVLISIGGGNASVIMHNVLERDIFISSMNNIINTYGFDGIDIDLEGNSLFVTGGSIFEPVDAAVIYLIEAINQIMDDYQQNFQRPILLTMAPETAYVQGGQSAYGGVWGAYLPLIEAFRNSIDLLHVQLYNSGSMYGVDGKIYTQSTPDFIVAMCEAVIHGFQTAGGFFEGLPAHKIAVGLPACISAAGGGYTHPTMVKYAVDYLMGNGEKPGHYTLQNAEGYPDLGGMMTWSINWDAATSCGGLYEYAQNFEDIFDGNTNLPYQPAVERSFSFYPNPASNYINLKVQEQLHLPMQIEIYNAMGQHMLTEQIQQQHQRINLDKLTPGLYIIKTKHIQKKLIISRN